MRKIINGKIYDTETAQLIAENIQYTKEQWSAYWKKRNSQASNFGFGFYYVPPISQYIFNAHNDYLYKTKKGNYFIIEYSLNTKKENIRALEKISAKSVFENAKEPLTTWEEAFDENLIEA